MNTLKTGQFYGQTNETIHLDGITLTDTEYTNDKVDWHYHENAYFTFILDGKVLEGNKKEIYHCSAGSLLFHNWEEAHYNIKPKGYTRGFHIELEQKWFDSFGISTNAIRGSTNLVDPQTKILMYHIFKETKLNNTDGSLGIDALLIELFSRMQTAEEYLDKNKPQWVKQLRNILHDTTLQQWTLQSLAQAIGVHPVHLSREFTKHFNCNLGEYIRTIKIQKALAMLPDKTHSLTDIALDCGFADQSHFIRCFKSLTHTTPFHYRKLLV